MYNEGIDLEVTGNVPSPLSGYAQIVNSSLLPVSVQDSYSGSSYSGMGVILRPSEPSYAGIYIILSNLVPVLDLARERQFVTAGDSLGSVPENSFLHVEIIKEINGVGYRLDPTPYLQPRLEPNVSLALECNDVVIRTGGVVVERRNLVDPAELVSRELLGEPLVVGE